MVKLSQYISDQDSKFIDSYNQFIVLPIRINGRLKSSMILRL